MRRSAVVMMGALAVMAFAGTAGAKDWTDHSGKIPFIVGREAGMKEAKFSGRPVLYFFTATW